MKLKTMFGLGDAAALAFKPMAWAIDKVWGTDLLHCEKCAERRAKWNALFSRPAWELGVLALLTLVAVIGILL
jgi:hypothetical protein